MSDNLSVRFPLARLIVTSLLITGVMLTGFASAQVITEFPLTPPSGPWGIAAGPDGNLWFTEFDGSRVGRITIAGVVTRFPVTGGAWLGITAGPDGNLWYIEATNSIGRITTAGVVTHFPLTPNSFPWEITAGPDGNLWFTESGIFVNKIGRITTSGVITEFPIPTASSSAMGIAAGPDGNLWFTEESGNRIGRITTAGVVTEFPIPTPNSVSSSIAAGPDGNLWFTQGGANKIGRITTAGVITEFPMPNPGAGSFHIVAGPNGNLWFTESDANKIGWITTGGTVTEFPIPTPSSAPDGIAMGSDANIWFTERGANKIGRITTTDNTSPSSAKNVVLGSVSTDMLGSAPADENWFRYTVKAGRSYCVEVDNGKREISVRDTVLNVYHADAVALAASNDDIAEEPGGPLLSRVCYLATASEDNLAKVTTGALGTAGAFRVRVTDTTLFCPWFFSGSGFEAFILVKNTTGNAHNATVTLASTAGATLGTQGGTAPANGSYNLQVSAAPPMGFGLTSANGGVYIAHDGPPGSLIANVTSLSFTSGVSFDTPAVPRPDFR